MITLISLFLGKYLDVIIGVVCFVSGVMLTNAIHSWKTSHDNNLVLKQMEAQQVKDRKVITDYQSNLTELQKQYILLGKKKNEIKLTTAPCKLTPSAVQLWNKSSSPEASLPSDTSRTSEGTSSVSGVGVDLAIQNKLDNDLICNGMRQQLEAIIKWNKETYGN